MKEKEIILKKQLGKEKLEKVIKAKESSPIGIAGKLFPEHFNQLKKEGLFLPERVKRVKQFIAGKSIEEIFSRAQKAYKLQMDKDNFEYAYDIATEYLDEKRVEAAAQELFKEALQEMRELKDKAERIKAAKKILSNTFVPEIKHPSEIVEEALETLFLLRDKRGRRTEAEFYQKNFTLQTLEWLELPIKNEIIFKVAHFLAKGKIRYLIQENKEKALEAAQNYVNKGLLDLDADSDLFEELTK